MYSAGYRSGKGALRKSPETPTFHINAVELGGDFSKYSPWKRLRQERAHGRAVAGHMSRFKPDVVVSSNTPLFAQRAILRHARKHDIAFVFWQQDIYGIAMQEALAERVPFVGGKAGSIFPAMERRMLRESDAVVTISPDFLPVLQDWGVEGRRVQVIENWAPIEELPMRSRDNPWARRYELSGKTVFLYAGTIGLKHDPALLKRLVAALEASPNAVLVIASEGPGADWLREHVANLQPEKAMIVGFQPYEMLPDMLASADVLVAILNQSAGVFSVPSKILTYHCAQRPILAAVPRENLAARTITRARSGLVVDPQRPDDFVAAAMLLADDRSLRDELGANARRYATTAFDIQAITDAFETVINRAGGVASPTNDKTSTRARVIL